jgi:hypothetical protein
MDHLEQLIGFSVKNRIYELKKDWSQTLLKTHPLTTIFNLIKKN